MSRVYKLTHLRFPGADRPTLKKSFDASITHVSSSKQLGLEKLKFANVTVHPTAGKIIAAKYASGMKALDAAQKHSGDLSVMLEDVNAKLEKDVTRFTENFYAAPLALLNRFLPKGHMVLHRSQINAQASRIDNGFLFVTTLKDMQYPSKDTLSLTDFQITSEELNIGKDADWTKSLLVRMGLGIEDKGVNFDVPVWVDAFKQKEFTLETQGEVIRKVVPQVIKYIVKYDCPSVAINDGKTVILFTPSKETVDCIRKWDSKKEEWNPSWTFGGEVEVYEMEDMMQLIFCKLFEEAESRFGKFNLTEGPELGTWGEGKVPARGFPKV